MTTFLLCWYALGWVAMGMEYIAQPYQHPFGCMLTAPIAVFILSFVIFEKHALNIDRGKQYLWRKP